MDHAPPAARRLVIEAATKHGSALLVAQAHAFPEWNPHDFGPWRSSSA